MKTVLITGFEPFGGEQLNPSALAAQALDGRKIADRHVAGVVLPCVFGESLAVLKKEIRRIRPELVICTGQAIGRAEISVERVAINVMDADIPDNAGNQPIDEPVVTDGPVAYSSTLPIKEIVAALRKADLSAAVSQSAGTYVCNYVFYGLMRMLARKSTIRGGFIHVPCLPEQLLSVIGGPSMPLEQIVRALEIAIETSLETKHDLCAMGGAIS